MVDEEIADLGRKHDLDVGHAYDLAISLTQLSSSEIRRGGFMARSLDLVDISRMFEAHLVLDDL